MYMRLTVSTRLHVINAIMCYMHVYMKEYKRSGIYIVLSQVCRTHQCAKRGNPTKLSEEAILQEHGLPPPTAIHMDASPDSPLPLAIRTGPQVPCSNPHNGLAHSTCR